MAKGRILLVEDDSALAELLVFNLRREEFEVRHTADGEEALLGARSRCCLLEVGSVLANPPIVVGDRRNADVGIRGRKASVWRRACLRASALHRRELGRVEEVLETVQVPAAIVDRLDASLLPLESTDAAVDVGPPARLRELAIVHDIDARLYLAAHDVCHGILECLFIGDLVDCLAALPRHLEINDLRRPDQAAGMAGQDSVCAMPHGFSLGQSELGSPALPG